MAPNKKKKKAAENPARGFATVSRPSKSKVDESTPEAKAGQTEPGLDRKALPDVQHTAGATDSVKGHQALQDMTPEQLEAHLDDADLQSILDTHGQRSKREAVRQVTRLEIERRTLRTQAFYLEASGWLSDELVEEVIRLSNSETPMAVPGNGISPPTSLPDKSMNETDLCVRLWTLQTTLNTLHFVHTDSALKHLLTFISVFHDSSSLTSREFIWGLEECFQWLALHTNCDELPSYIRHDRPPHTPFQNGLKLEDMGGEDLQPAFPARATQKTLNLPSTGFSTPELSCSPYNTEREDSESRERGSVGNTMTSDNTDEEDNNPEMLVTKYVQAKSALFRAEHEKEQEQSGGSVIMAKQGSLAAKILRLRKTMENIERDVLFDRDEATVLWNDALKDIQPSLPRQKRFQAPNEGVNDNCINGNTGDNKEAVDSEPDDSDSDMLGTVFDDPKQPSIQDNVPKEQETMHLLDFGRWTGVSPRKVLEEACKARDPASKISLYQIYSSSYSNRQRLHIRWSKAQQQGSLPHTILATLSCEFRPRSASISMDSVSTPTALQAEAYVSTVALFAVFAGVAKEEKVFLRLPTVWRDLWKDLAQKKQTESDSRDKSSLKHIRSLIDESLPNPEVMPSRLSTKTDSHVSVSSAPNGRRTAGPRLAPEQLQTLWTQKASTAAYQRMLQTRSQLPIWEHREHIVHTLTTQQVTILCADTGAGKSTQVPSFILQNELSLGHDCRIFVTQPRRISAISLAKRVSDELGEARNDLGTTRSLVGYAIRLESKTSSSTRVTYATTGVLLRILENSPDLDEVDYLILDEIHERTMDLDLLFITVRSLILRRPELRVVLMSATVDAQKFSDYFGGSPILNIPGRTYPVEVKYLEDAIEVTNKGANSRSPAAVDLDDEDSSAETDGGEKSSLATGLENYSDKTRTTLAAYDEYRIDYALIADLASVISSEPSYEKYSKAILIFMPGISEIRRLHQTIMSHPSFIQRWVIHLLHSSFSTEDLEQAFMPAPPGMRKIVIATNIAETGITIPDITAVIDTCKEKTMRFDERRQLSRLSESFISRSSSRQRRGRAARVQDGLCFHLVTRYRHERLMAEHHVPEMLRLSLQDPVLRVKVWDLGDIEKTLSEALDPPTSKNIRRAIESLKEAGALTAAETLTPLGRQLARLPLDLWLGKLAVLGITFGCLDAAITIAAMLSAKSPFAVSNHEDPRAKLARLSFKRGDSDLLLMFNAYLGWRRASRAGTTNEYCRKNFLNSQALSQIEDQKVQLLVALSDAGLLTLDDTERSSLRKARSSGRKREFFDIPERFNINHDSDIAINSLVALGFYPKLIVREDKGWRNVSTNQHVSLAPTSVNKEVSEKPPKWLSFYQAMQTKSRNLNVFDTSAVPESAIVLLLGDADFKLFSGVIAIDGGKIRFAVRDWKTMIALKVLRGKIQGLMTQKFRNPARQLSPLQQQWFEIWQAIINPKSGTADVEGGRARIALT